MDNLRCKSAIKMNMFNKKRGCVEKDTPSNFYSSKIIELLFVFHHRGGPYRLHVGVR